MESAIHYRQKVTFTEHLLRAKPIALSAWHIVKLQTPLSKSSLFMRPNKSTHFIERETETQRGHDEVTVERQTEDSGGLKLAGLQDPMEGQQASASHSPWRDSMGCASVGKVSLADQPYPWLRKT